MSRRAPESSAYPLGSNRDLIGGVIDDEIIADVMQQSEAGEAADGPPFFTAEEAIEPVEAPEPAPAEAAPLLDVAAVGKQDAEVPIKPLADAFLDKQIVCGVLKPEATDTHKAVIARAVRAAAVADIVIIDWFLRKNSDKLAGQSRKAF